MAIFVKEGTFGRYRDVPGGQSDPECTHVILKLKEYEKLFREQTRAEQETRSAKYSAERAIEEAKRNARYTDHKAAEEARQMVAGMETALAAEKDESAHQRALNANLLRISKERANADRKLKPKKEHTGYQAPGRGSKGYEGLYFKLDLYPPACPTMSVGRNLALSQYRF